MANKQVEKGAFVFQEGDIADVAYLIVSGKIELLRSDRGQWVVVKVVSPNEIFGDLAVFDPNTLRPYSSRATEPTELIPITPEEVTALTSNASKPVQQLLSMAFDKMKLVRSKTISKQNAAVTSSIKKITVTPLGEKMSALVKQVEVTPNKLPFRFGGFPEGGEPNRRDTVHMSIPSQTNPLRVSRQHCEIAFEDENLVVVDLGSRFCSTVNTTMIGRGRGSYSAPLTMGKNILTLGSADGNYTFTVTCE